MGTGLAVATTCVVLGLLIEYKEDAEIVLLAIGRSIKFKQLKHLRALQHKAILAFIGALFVTCGVVGELWYGYRAEIIEEHLRAANGLIVAELNSKSSTADERSKTLELENIRLRKELIQTEMAIAPLSLKESTEEKIAADLRREIKPGTKISLLMNNGNGGMIAMGIFHALDLAGLNPALHQTDKSLYEVQVNSSAQQWPICHTIEDIFEKYGIVVLPDASLPPGSPITITVGDRWIGPLPSISSITPATH